MSSSAADTFSITEALASGPKAILYRGVRNSDGLPVILKVLDPRRSRPKDLEQLKHEYEIGTLLDSPAIVRAARPRDVRGHAGPRPGGLRRPVPRPPPRSADGGGALPPARDRASRRRSPRSTARTSSTRTSSPRTSSFGPDGEVKITDFGIASPPPARARRRAEPELDRGLVALHVAGADGADEPPRRQPHRSLLARRHLLPDAHGPAPLPGARSRWSGSTATSPARPRPPSRGRPRAARVLARIVLKLLAKMRRGPLPERSWPPARPRAVPRSSGGRAGRSSRSRSGQRDVSDRFQIPQKLYGREAEIADSCSGLRSRGRHGNTGARARLRLLRDRQVLARARAPPADRARARLLRLGQVRPVQARHPVRHVRPGLPRARRAKSSPRAKSASRRGGSGARSARSGPTGSSSSTSSRSSSSIIGPQPPVAELPPLEAQNRFHIVFRHFIGVFARKEHPLALFLDDLQWADSASLELIEDLVIHSGRRVTSSLLGAYRDNEVGPSHPLMLDAGQDPKGGRARSRDRPRPARREHLAEFVADTLHCRREERRAARGAGPREDGRQPLLRDPVPHHAPRRAPDRVRRARGGLALGRGEDPRQGFTDNVVDLMAGKLRRLPAATRGSADSSLRVSGAQTDLHTLAAICNQSEEETARTSRRPSAKGSCSAGTAYAFLHDRVQQAAYALIGDDENEGAPSRASDDFSSEASTREASRSGSSTSSASSIAASSS